MQGRGFNYRSLCVCVRARAFTLAVIADLTKTVQQCRNVSLIFYIVLKRRILCGSELKMIGRRGRGIRRGQKN
jgi:hypothetical protein